VDIYIYIYMDSSYSNSKSKSSNNHALKTSQNYSFKALSFSQQLMDIHYKTGVESKFLVVSIIVSTF